jgi:hypothetical protein
MANKIMLFGPIGRQVGIPWPEAGMGMDYNLSTETTDLLNGEQAVWRAPLAYKSFNMSWRGGADLLQPLVDMYSGLYGQGPYYISDPLSTIQGNNMLQAKWASPHLLEHVANGWGSPVISSQLTTPEQKQITFTGSADEPDDAPFASVTTCVPGKPMYLTVWGTRTGTANMKVYRYSKAAAAWSLFISASPSLTPGSPRTIVSQTEANAGDIVAVKLVPFVTNDAVLTLQHIDLAVNDYRTYTPYVYSLDPGLYPALTLYPGMVLYPSAPAQPEMGGSMFRAGKGTGPVQFTGNLGGKLDSATINQIGLSVDICEVSRDKNNW